MSDAAGRDTQTMAVGLGSHARHRLGVGRGRRPRHRVAARSPRRARWCARRRGSGRGSCSIASTICAPRARLGRRRARVRTASSTARARCATSCRADDLRTLAVGGAARRVAAARAARRPPARAREGARARAAARGAVPRRDGPHLLPRPAVRRAAPPAVRSRDHRARSARAIGSSWSRCAIPTARPSCSRRAATATRPRPI